MPPAPRRAPALILRALRIIAAWSGALLTFAFALVGGALVHLDLPVARRLAVTELNGILATQFKGKVTIDRLAHLSLFGARGVDATITTESGTKIAMAKGVAGRISPLAIVRSALFGKGDLRIGVTSLSVDAIDVDVDTRADGSLELVHAFDPVTPSPPSPPGSRGTAIDLAHIAVHHAWVHGTMAGAPPIDADVDALLGSFRSTTAVTEVDLGHLVVLARGLPKGIRARTDVEGHFAMPSPSGAGLTMRGTLAGRVGDVPLTASVSMDGDRVDGILDVPEVTAEEVRASVEDVPLYESASLHAEAHGDLANLAVTLGATLGRGTVALNGFVHAKGPLGGNVTLVASHLDARTFAKDGPAADLGMRIEAKATMRADGDLVADASLDMPEGTLAGQLVPASTLKLSATKGPDAAHKAVEAHLEGMVREPGAPLAVTADGTFRDGASKVTFGAKAAIPRLADVRRLGSVGSGSADLTLSGHAAIDKATSFEAKLVVDAHGLDRPGVHVERLHLAATAHGSPASPELAALVDARGLAASEYRFSRAEVVVAGTPKEARVAVSAVGDRSPDVTVQGDLALAPGLTVRDLRVGLERRPEAVTVAVKSLRLEGPVFDARGIVVTGAGAPLHASVHGATGALSVTATSEGLDLGKLAYLVGQRQDERAGGEVAMDVDLDARPGHAKGKVVLDLTKGAWSSVRGAEAHVGVELEGRRLTGKVHADLGAVGSLDVSDVDVHVGGAGPLDTAAWKKAWGTMTVAANVDMARLAALAPPGSLHMADVAGRVTLTGHVARDSLSDTTPEIRLALATVGLAATGESTRPVREPGGPLMVGPASWSLHGIDARLQVLVDGIDSTSEVALSVVDEHGALVGVDLKTDPLPFEEILRGRGDVLARIEDSPVSLRVTLPERELGSLPLLVRPDGFRGELGGTLSMSGTAKDPLVDLALKTRKLVVAAAPDTTMDGALDAHYDGANAQVKVALETPQGPLLSAEGHLRASAKDIVLAKGLPERWGGGLTAKLARFPLGAIGVLSDDQVKGFVSGNLGVSDLHENAKAAVDLTLDGLQMGKAKFTSGTVHAALDEKGLAAKARLEDPKGFLEADTTMGMTWGSALVPTSDGTGLQAKLLAKHFSAAAAAPFVSSALSELSGWVDADANVTLVPKQKPKMSGSVSWTDGVLQVPAIGEEFHAVKAKVTLSDDGLVRLEDVEARGLSGRLTASGSAHLDGTTLVAANLALDIRKADAIPLDVQGSNLGTVYGNVTVKATGTPDGKLLKVAVAVPHVHVDLPSGSLPRSPEALADAPSVHMGVYTSPDRFLVLPLDGAPVRLVARRNTATAPVLPAGGVGAPTLVEPPAGEAEAAKAPKTPPMEVDATIHLGDVQVVRGQQLAVHLDGDLTAKVAAATTVRGEVHLKSGKLAIQSKEFEIEKGTISFVGDDPSNPEVTVTAGWGAPDGTKVLADYVGPVKTGKVTLRSEPPRPKNEIVQLILFGTADGSEATPYASKSPSTGTQAGTAVGGLATDGLSKGLDQLTGMNVTTKVDTSDSSNPRADVELQIAKDISLQLAYVIVQPPPGDNPDLVYATIDWRFVRNWSLETTFGDAGSTFADMVWQYRY